MFDDINVKAMMDILYIFMAIAMGVMLAVYLPMNSSVAEYLGSPITANITFFSVALISSIVIFLVWGESGTIHRIKSVPIWLYITGIASAAMILGTTYLIPRIGARQLFLLTVSGQILMAMLISHFGLLGVPKDTISMNKIIGAVFIFAGAVFSVL